MKASESFVRLGDLFRAECSLEKLRALNDYVKIHLSTQPLSKYLEENFERFSVRTTSQ